MPAVRWGCSHNVHVVISTGLEYFFPETNIKSSHQYELLQQEVALFVREHRPVPIDRACVMVIQFLASSAKFALSYFIPLTSLLIKVQIQKFLGLDSRKIEGTG